MSLPVDITALLHGRTVEWERLEFKRGWNPQDVLHTLCAFANDFHNLGGGYLILGVAEHEGRPALPPAGLEPGSLDRIQKELLNLGQNAIVPPYHPIAVPMDYSGSAILVLWAPGGQSRPYRARTSLSKESREYAYYIRKGSSTVRARTADESELMSLAATVPFDDRVNLQARPEDLSRPLMCAFLEEIGSKLASEASSLPLPELARRMHLLGGTSEASFPLNVGLLFFHPEPHRFFPGTQIDVVWFGDGAGGDQFTEKIFRGPLHQMLREALDYIRRNYLNELVIKRKDRAEALRVANFPFAAIEEALVNAVYHRSYEIREPIEVRISPTELVVLSYPGPDRSVKPEQLRMGRALSRRYRNRRIGELLKELKLTEGRATGLPKIQRAMRENGSPDPLFETDEDHSYFSATLLVHPGLTADVDPNTADVDGPTAEVARLLQVMQGAQRRKELQSLLGLVHDEHFRQAYLQPALRGGFIEMTLPDKPRSSQQRYELTERGRQWRAAHGRKHP